MWFLQHNEYEFSFTWIIMKTFKLLWKHHQMTTLNQWFGHNFSNTFVWWCHDDFCFFQIFLTGHCTFAMLYELLQLVRQPILNAFYYVSGKTWSRKMRKTCSHVCMYVSSQINEIFLTLTFIRASTNASIVSRATISRNSP